MDILNKLFESLNRYNNAKTAEEGFGALNGMINEANKLADKPHRVQRKRTKGWKMPPNTIYVGRPSKWGNPFKAGSFSLFGRKHYTATRKEAVEQFKEMLNPDSMMCLRRDSTLRIIEEIKLDMAGKNLACWCPLDQPCHADILLEIANR